MVTRGNIEEMASLSRLRSRESARARRFLQLVKPFICCVLLYLTVRDLGRVLHIVVTPGRLYIIEGNPNIIQHDNRTSLDFTDFQFPIDGLRRVVFNSVPKCASRTMMRLSTMLSMTHGFHNYKIKDLPYRGFKESEEAGLVAEILKTPVYSLYDRHMPFINFERHNATQPVYINVIRDPVERAASRFYYTTRNKTGVETTKMETELFDECVAKDGDDCKGHAFYVTLFCGNKRQCRRRDNDKKRLSKFETLNNALHNIEVHYGLVGLMEDMDTFLQLAEVMYPLYFTHAHRYYVETGALFLNASTTKQRRTMSPKTRRLVEKRMHKDVALYKFVKARFYNTAAKYLPRFQS